MGSWRSPARDPGPGTCARDSAILTSWTQQLVMQRSEGTGMSLKVWIDGKLFDKADAKISVYDHCLLYGDGVFEGIRVYDGKVFRLKEHVERLFESARHIKLEIPLSREQMVEAILATVKANDKKNGYIRPVVTRGAGYLGLDPRKTS